MASNAQSDILKEEMDYFNASLSEWLGQFAGRVVLIKGNSLIGVFDDESDALEEGARRFGMEPFLVRRVTDRPNQLEAPAYFLGILSAASKHPSPVPD